MSVCCADCFEDLYLQEYILHHGELNNCDFCDQEGIKCIDVKNLLELFEPLIELYEPVINFMSSDELRDYEGHYIGDELTWNWGIFENVEIAKSIITSMFTPWDPKEDGPLFLDQYVVIVLDYFGDENVSETAEKKWEILSENIKLNDRFLHKPKELELDLLLELFQNIEYTIETDKEFYRARNSYRNTFYEPNKMGMPPRDKTLGGRANPAGIPYLYLATDPNTAISEIRPNVTDFITVGKFKSINNIITIDLRQVSPFHFTLSENFLEGIELIGFFNRLASDLTIPINSNDSFLDYLPTQYLSEFFKQNGWDGIIYKSSFGLGHNLTLFSEEKVQCLETTHYEIINTSFETRSLD